jgi:hypothetical protein
MFYKHSLLTVLPVHILFQKPTKDVINTLHFLPTVTREPRMQFKTKSKLVIICDKPESQS